MGTCRALVSLITFVLIMRYYNSRRPFIKQSGAFSSMRQATNPPPFVQKPWNKWTYEATVLTSDRRQLVSVRVSDVLTQLKTFCQVDSTAALRFRVVKSQVWGTSVGPAFPSPNCETKFYQPQQNYNVKAFDPNTRYPRSTMRDRGTVNSPSKVCYKWPLVDRMKILDNDAGAQELVLTDVVNAGTDLTT